MLTEYLAEAVGSFVFFSIILTKSDAVMIAVALLVGILLASVASQGHLNPAVTAMMYMNGKVGGETALSYVAAQLVGAVLAVQYARMVKA
jgi:glycerol uptake facilitator-like aquaporin